MKRPLFLLALLFLCASTIFAQTAPILKFENKQVDFGVVNKKERPYLDVYFKFTNTDNTPIIIYNATVSCGCMTPYYSNKPVLKGETGTIRVRIDTKSQGGKFLKNIIIKSNAKNDLEIIKIAGTIN